MKKTIFLLMTVCVSALNGEALSEKPTHAEVGQKFHTQVDDYAKGRRPYSKELLDFIAHKVSQRVSLDKANVLDLGCGTGISTRALHEKGMVQVKGLDISSGMLERAQATGTVSEENYFLGGVTELGDIFKDEKFDAMTAFSAFHWFCNKESVDAINNSLTEDGMFFVAKGSGDSNSQSEHKAKFWGLIESIKGSPVHNPRENYNPVEVLKDGGFKVEEFHFQRENSYTFEEAVAKHRSFSGWCNMTEEQKMRGEEPLKDLVRGFIEEQNHDDGLYRTTVEEVCIVASK